MLIAIKIQLILLSSEELILMLVQLIILPPFIKIEI